MPAKKSRWAEHHAFCQETITRQRAEIDRLQAETAALRERVEALESSMGTIRVGPGGALYGG